jgi:hypothetical protein
MLTKWLTSQQTPWGQVLEKQQVSAYSRVYKYFMEPEALLTYSQESTADLCPQPDESSPYNPTSFLYD